MWETSGEGGCVEKLEGHELSYIGFLGEKGWGRRKEGGVVHSESQMGH